MQTSWIQANFAFYLWDNPRSIKQETNWLGLQPNHRHIRIFANVNELSCSTVQAKNSVLNTTLRQEVGLSTFGLDIRNKIRSFLNGGYLSLV